MVFAHLCGQFYIYIGFLFLYEYIAKQEKELRIHQMEVTLSKLELDEVKLINMP